MVKQTYNERQSQGRNARSEFASIRKRLERREEKALRKALDDARAIRDDGDISPALVEAHGKAMTALAAAVKAVDAAYLIAEALADTPPPATGPHDEREYDGPAGDQPPRKP